MQDLKNLSQKKTSSGFSFSGNGRRNRRINQSSESTRPKLPFPSGKRLRQLKLLLMFIAIVLGLAPLCVLALRQTESAGLRVTSWIRNVTGSGLKSAPETRARDAANHFATASDMLETADINNSGVSARTPEGLQYVYTIQGDLQQKVHDYLAKYNVPYGVFVAIEPASGRILGMTAYSSVDPGWTKRSAYELYPMASLFKIITASAALENNKITPESVVEFRGKNYSENPRYWEVSPRGSNSRANVTYAMGKSINPVYGRVASDIAGKSSVMESVSRFGFNQKLLPETPAKQSQAEEPADDHKLMLMGAGLDHDVKISPLHAAVIMSAIANGGKMMAPGLTSAIIDAKGAEKEIFVPRELRQLVTPEISTSLTQILSSTVLTGTSRKAFHDRRGRPLINVSIAAKTGSINGSDPKGHYSWFAAFAPIQNPQIAVVALVINSDKWRIKASQVGAEALYEFFR
ncbi:MAG: penicillin-binding transpeptidase domain-containing protein [Desulfuromonadaceae bacterium]